MNLNQLLAEIRLFILKFSYLFSSFIVLEKTLKTFGCLDFKLCSSKLIGRSNQLSHLSLFFPRLWLGLNQHEETRRCLELPLNYSFSIFLHRLANALPKCVLNYCNLRIVKEK